MFIVLDPFDKRQRSRAARHGDHGQAAQGVGRAGQGRPGHRLRRVADPRPGLAGGFKFIVEDRGGLGLGGLAETDRRAGPQAEGPARPEQRGHPVPLQHAAALPRHRPHQGRLPGRVARRREPDARHVPRLALRQQLQRVRPALAGHHPGGGPIPQSDRGHQPVPGPQQPGPDGPAGHAGHAARDRRPDLSITRYNLYTAAAVTGNIHGHQHRRRHRGHRPHRRRNAAAVDEGRVDRADVHADPGRQHGDVRLPLAVICVFLALSALYESWALPLAVILVVPLCLLCSVAGVLLHATATSISSCRSAWSCWSAWRARTPSSSSSTPSSCTRRAGRSSRRRRRRRGCGCGRS